MCWVIWAYTVFWDLRGIFIAGTYFAVLWKINVADYWYFMDLFRNLGSICRPQQKCIGTYMCNVADIFVSDICQLCEMYVYQCLCSHYWLHPVHMRYMYWHSCLIYAYEVISVCGIYSILGGYLFLCGTGMGNRSCSLLIFCLYVQ